SDLVQIVRKSVKRPLAVLHMGDLASAKDESYLCLVAFFKKAANMLYLEEKVVLIRLGTKLYLLELNQDLLFLCLLHLLALLILELAVIHDPADRWYRRR